MYAKMRPEFYGNADKINELVQWKDAGVLCNLYSLALEPPTQPPFSYDAASMSDIYLYDLRGFCRGDFFQGDFCGWIFSGGILAWNHKIDVTLNVWNKITCILILKYIYLLFIEEKMQVF